jgi:NAD(P)-dependent dehydrogenase (short-subunit alcohol dehydrogenase family)
MNENDTVVVIGGSSGIGLAVARRSLADGARVVIAGRSQQRLDQASRELGRPGQLTAVPADIADRAQLSRVFDRAGTLAHLVVTAADLPYGAALTLTEDSVMRALRSKILGPLFAAQLATPRMTAPGSITFTSASPPTGQLQAGRWPPRSTARWRPWSARWRWNSARSASTPCPPAGWTRQSGTSWPHQR